MIQETTGRNVTFKDFVRGLIMLTDMYVVKTSGADKGFYLRSINCCRPSGAPLVYFNYADGEGMDTDIDELLKKVPDEIPSGVKLSLRYGANYASSDGRPDVWMVYLNMWAGIFKYTKHKNDVGGSFGFDLERI